MVERANREACSQDWLMNPREGFDWSAVSWGPCEPPLYSKCSYCDAPFGAGELAMVIGMGTTHCARFCEDCQARWWGVERLA